MKKFAFIASFGLLVLAINSCCKLCTIDYSKISFYGYTELEMDSVSIITYEAGSDVRVDSIYINAFNEGDHFAYRMDKPLSADFDYEINIYRTKQAFDITDLVIESRKCNCDEADYLKSYALDGTSQEGNIVINK